MILKPIDVALNKIMVDPYNPRYIKSKTIDQSSLINEMLSQKSSKELLNSMQEDIKWVNRIVVQKLETHEEFEKINTINHNFDYIVVEGNTRLSCLKSGYITNYVNETEIPVLLADKEHSETIEEFRKQIRITQGIANVTVVKEWSQVAKAKHLNALFNDSIEGKRAQEVYKDISTELGINLKEVRELIIRYKIFKKITDISDTIPDEQWGYLEAFDKNAQIRKIIGFNTEMNDFIENDEEFFEEILSDIPSLIKSALQQGLNTKNFRDIIIDISNNHKTSEEFNSVVKEILDINSEVSLVSLKNNMKINSDKEQWEDDLNQVFNKVSNFPSVSDWAKDLLQKLKDIESKVNKHISIINENP